MEHQERLFELLTKGSVEGLHTKPTVVETVMSRVFIFESELRVLKLYKRDNEWWNTQMQDLSKGATRVVFITNDFLFNQVLNPQIYLALKEMTIVDDQIVLIEPTQDADELLIVMQWQEMSCVLTQVLHARTLNESDYMTIGASFVKAKETLPASFLPHSTLNWYEHMVDRLDDLASWARSVESFPQELGERALAQLRSKLEINKEAFSKLAQKDFSISIDCNSENLLYSNGELRFIDAFSPKESWRIAVFEVDLYKTGRDIYALAGEAAYEAYLKGIAKQLGRELDRTHEQFYLLYGALISGAYFSTLSTYKESYREIAEKYIACIQELVERGL